MGGTKDGCVTGGVIARADGGPVRMEGAKASSGGEGGENLSTRAIHASHTDDMVAGARDEKPEVG